MSKAGETFFTSIGCMDGRIQEPIRKFGQEKFGAEYPDTITEAGLVGHLANHPDAGLLDSIKKKVEISIGNHNSRGIVIFGHQECAASDAVEDIKHKDDIRRSVEVVQSLIDNTIPIVGVFVKRGENDWEVEEVV